MKFHALEAQARASSAPKWTMATNSSSAPPTRFGCWMRNSFASWKSRSVSSGMRRSSSHFAARSRRIGSSASAFSQMPLYLEVPVKNFFPFPDDDIRALQDVFVEALEVGDAVRRAGDVRMHADRHHARGLLT